MEQRTPYFSHRTCYVNFGEHLQNHWNVNMFYPGAPNRWSIEDWTAFLTMLKAFGFNCFEYWLPPTLFDLPSLQGGGVYTEFIETMRAVTDVAHTLGLKMQLLLSANVIGPDWFYVCPREAEGERTIHTLWRHWMRELAGTDYIHIFPGDLGGCNRNGCTHETFVDLALELTVITKRENPAARVIIGTWGTPFSGWGSDMRANPDWQGFHAQLPAIWNGTPDRAKAAISYLVGRLPAFPEDTMVAINLGFDPDGGATMGGDARPYAREIAKIRPIVSWNYSVGEGELVNYPHWRLPRMSALRREERSAAPYLGGSCYTMTPKLNLITLYAAGRFLQDPDTDPDLVSREFCMRVFGEEHATLGELFETFEVVQGWGHYPRRKWSKTVLRAHYAEISERLEAADTAHCVLPLFPDPDTYRQNLLWFAQTFYELAGPNPDRERIKREYRAKSLAIYDVIPKPVDDRAERASQAFSQILA